MRSFALPRISSFALRLRCPRRVPAFLQPAVRLPTEQRWPTCSPSTTACRRWFSSSSSLSERFDTTGNSSIANEGGAPSRSARDLSVERLSFEVFEKGNQHLKNVETLSSLPEGLHSFPEVCFIGKPSVGKSSLISCLLHNPRLGKTGNVRGTTRLLQFFNVGDALLLVDTPGYGGWKGRETDDVPRDRANAFSILFRYLALRKRANLKRVYWCMEASATGPMRLQARDEDILAFLQREQIAFTVVLTKIDRHWRYFRDETRITDTVGRDGVVIPTRRQQNHRCHITTPAEGIRENMQAVFRFLGSREVPILGVSANRWAPERSINITALQHDIVDHCTRELPNMEDLTYESLHDLSYSPPLAEDIARVQRAYPVESFVVPQDDRLSLQEMVNRHEHTKAHLLRASFNYGLIPAKDLSDGFLMDSRALQRVTEREDEERRLQNELPPTLSYDPPFMLPAGSQAHEKTVSESASLQQKSRSLRPTLRRTPPRASTPGMFGEHNASTVFAVADRVNDKHTGGAERDSIHDCRGTTPAERSEACTTQTSPAADAALLQAAGRTGMALPTVPPDSLPVALDPQAYTVTAINGVQIPRSLVPSGVSDLANKKEDELPAFAAKSGAGAYESLLLSDTLPSKDGDKPVFLENDEVSALPEEYLDSTTRFRTKSAARKQQERFLKKYVALHRKERSISMQAEGYMCPWLASAGQYGRNTVMGLQDGDSRSMGRGGTIMKGLKKTGFGGKSYSARTLRGHGRATTKTGKWAT